MYEEYAKHISTDISEDIETFVNNEVFGNSEYLFIEKKDGINYGFCSKCGHEYKLEKSYKHNESGICPICGANLQVKLSRFGRKNCKNDACFYFFEKSVIDPKIVICKGYYVTRSYEHYRYPKTEYMLEAIYIFKENEKGKMLKLLYSNYYGESWDEKKTSFNFNQGWLATKMCYFSPESIKKAIKGTKFQYIPKRLFQGDYSIIKIFDEFAKYPWLEQLYKVGFKNIVDCKISGNLMYNCLNYRGKDLFKILRLTRKDVKDIREADVFASPLFLRLYQLSKKYKANLSPKEVEKLGYLSEHNLDKFIGILKYSTMLKAYRYMKKQSEIKRKDTYFNILSTWDDYINDCYKLKMDLTNDSVLYPKDIHTAHQNTIKQIKMKEDETLNKAIYIRLKSLEKYSFEKEGLVIRPAISSLELIEEGKALSHCVGGYAGKYARGETNIFLIRKTNEPNKPLYTLEFKNNSIIQVRGKNNCKPSKEVELFIEAFKETKLTKKTKSKVKKSA